MVGILLHQHQRGHKIAVKLFQAGIQIGYEGVFVHVAANEHQLGHAVAEDGIPIAQELGLLLEDPLHLLLRCGGHEEAVLDKAHLQKQDSLLRQTVTKEEQFGISTERQKRKLPIEGMHFFCSNRWKNAAYLQ